jgi:hypothetical protein
MLPFMHDAEESMWAADPPSKMTAKEKNQKANFENQKRNNMVSWKSLAKYCWQPGLDDWTDTP